VRGIAPTKVPILLLAATGNHDPVRADLGVIQKDSRGAPAREESMARYAMAARVGPGKKSGVCRVVEGAILSLAAPTTRRS
jgi:hypothetical protein